jgi:hypothetical protein
MVLTSPTVAFTYLTVAFTYLTMALTSPTMALTASVTGDLLTVVETKGGRRQALHRIRDV